MLMSGAYFPQKGSTFLVGENPQVPSVSFVYRKYEVGEHLQLLNAALLRKIVISLFPSTVTYTMYLPLSK